MRTVIVSIAAPRQSTSGTNDVILAAIGQTCSFMSTLASFAPRTTPIPATPAARESRVFVNDHAVDLRPPDLRRRPDYQFPIPSGGLRGVVDPHLSEDDKELLENTFHRSRSVRPPAVAVAA
jgi:hypothetical protein